VCGIDPFCCNVEWDFICCDEAESDAECLAECQMG
jgi:hypothetical protein